MADFVVSPLLRALLEKFDSLLDRIGLYGFPRNISTEELQSLICKTEENELQRKGHWLNVVKEWAYKIDDMLDELGLLLSSSPSSSSSTIICTKVRSFFSIPTRNPIEFLLMKMERELKFIGEILDETRVQFHVGDSEVGFTDTKITRSFPFVDESEIYGRRDDTEKIVAMLLSSSSEKKLEVISIVGMGGIGKTTLAQLVFNDQRVKSHFDELKVWVHVSEVFDERMIMEEIFKWATLANCCYLEKVVLAHRLPRVLRGMRFLIVLDDVWNVDANKWDFLKSVLCPEDIGGCKIIVTTRNEEVARIMGSNNIYHLEVLSESDCWLLLRNQALSPVQGEEEYVEIGKQIAAKCKGLPLAAKVTGVQLFCNREQSKWLLVRDADIFKLPEYIAHILPSFMLSYSRLPSHLKQCFAYCSIFPKDYNINREKLIYLWMAEGFIQLSQGNKTWEDIGNDYFMELVWKSFFKVVKQDAYGNIIECRMHDFIHYLACSVSSIGCSIVEVGREEMSLSESVHHSSLLCDSKLSAIPEFLSKAKNLRTLFLISATKDFVKAPFLDFGSLRVLDMSQTGIRKLPDSIGALKCLRYIDVSYSSIETLPESITSLKNLQTLKLVNCYRLVELPRDLKRLIKLRHLDNWQCGLLSRLPPGIGQLTYLQTLPVFIVAKNNPSSLTELRRLNLRGNLEIKNLEHVTSLTDASEANLKEKQNIRSLVLSWGHDVDANLGQSSEYVLEALQPHPNLIELSITGYKGINFPTWMWILENLVKISIINCKGGEHLPPLGMLPNLKYLFLKGIYAIKCIGTEFYGDGFRSGFPSLNVLEIYNMPNLEEWLHLEESLSSILTKAFPQLKTLIVERCPKLISLPRLPVLKDLALWNNSEILLHSMARLTSLSSLVINDFHELVSLPNELGNLSSIKKLTIYDCNNLTSLVDEGNRGLTSLQYLSILYCDKLKSFSNGLMHLLSLEELTIVGCPSLASLPYGMGRLTSLRKLVIRGCPKLEHLPMGFTLNTALQFLLICECPQLERHCQRGGRFWPMIAHIPSIEIDGCKINQSSMELERNSGRQGETSSAFSIPHIAPTTEEEIAPSYF